MTLMSNGALKEFPNNHAGDFTIRLAERVVLSEEWGVTLYSIVWHNDVSSSLHSKSTFTTDKVLLRQRFPTYYTSTTSSTTKKFVNHDVSVTVKDIPNFNTRSGMDMLRSVLNMSQNKYAAIANPSGWEKPERAKNGLLFNQDIVIHNPGYVRINGRNGKNQVAGVSDPYVDFDTTFARMLGLVSVDKSGNLHLGTNLSVLGVKSDNSSVAKSGDVVTKVSGGDFVRLSGLADYLVTGIDDRWGVDQSNLSSSLLRVYCDVSQSSYIGGIKAGVISEVPVAPRWGQQEYNPNNLAFYPLEKRAFVTINIHLDDQNGRTFHSLGVTSVVLKFKKLA